MDAHAVAETEQGSVFFLYLNACAEVGATTSPIDFSVIYLSPVRLETYEEHIAGLTTLDGLLDKLRAVHPNFDAALATAEEESYAHSLAMVRDGVLTRLHAERLRARLTQGELAAKAGLRQPNISRYEKVGVAMSIRTAKRLAAALELADYKVLLP
ncbi:MAG TPA: helix-turn-helix transcriptional regulator [Thermoanaerobaculaceae bacterium]|nr:helix-turn-helix transcriptional regulator [Thermoanaerobaculaceae bacterium]